MNDESQKQNLQTYWQPHLQSALLNCAPLLASDWNELYRAASDPLIWEQHPAKNRYEREVFAQFFADAIESKGALAVRENRSGRIIGSSRFVNHIAEKSQVEIGYTFLIREFWGTDANRQLKNLMLSHAFHFVDTVVFRIGENNTRSRLAIEKRGAQLVETEHSRDAFGQPQTTVIYAITKAFFEHTGCLLP